MRGYFIFVPVVVALTLAMLLAMPGLDGERTGADKPAAADRKLLGLQVFILEKVPPSERAWVKNVRLWIPWSQVEPSPGSFDWSAVDNSVNAVLADGCESILFLLGGPIPVWARDSQYGALSDNAPPQNLGDWYRYCAAVAERYGPVVDFYEIWNEPGWDRDSEVMKYGVYHFGGQVETDYLPLLQMGYAAVKEKDPTAAVICGALMYTLKDDPNVGTENYAMLFDEVNRPGQDVSIKIEATQPIAAEQVMCFNCNDARNGDDDTMGGPSLQTEWNFAEGHTLPGYTTWLCLENPGSEAVNVSLDYYCGDGSNVHKEVAVEANSRCTILVNQDSLGIGQHSSTHGDVSIKVSSSQPIVAERPMYFNSNDAWSGGNGGTGVSSSQTEWSFAEGQTGSSVQEYIYLQNPQAESAEVTLTFMMTKGEIFSRKVMLPGESRVTLNINELIGFHGCCDMVAVHPYKSPKFWGPFYANVVNTLRSKGATQEVVTSEVGWPSYSDGAPAAFNEQYQADAIGALGVGGLFNSGCLKIWVYRDVDEDPGTVWDGNYYGLFKYTSQPHPAWSSYVQWQQQLPHYPLLPSSLP